MFFGSPILVPYWSVLVIERLLRFWLTLFIQLRCLTLLPYLPNIGLLYLLSLHHDPRDIHINQEYRRTILFLNKRRHSQQEKVHPSPRLTTIVAIYLESCVNLREYSFTFIPPWWRFMKSTILFSLHSKEITYQQRPLRTFPIYWTIPKSSVIPPLLKPHLIHIFELVSV